MCEVISKLSKIAEHELLRKKELGLLHASMKNYFCSPISPSGRACRSEIRNVSITAKASWRCDL